MMSWLAKRPEWTQAKELSISTHSFEVGAVVTLAEGEADDISQDRIRFTPSRDWTASFWHQGRYIRLSRSRVQEGVYVKQILTIKLVFSPPIPFSSMLIDWDARILARDPKVVSRLLVEAKGAWKTAKAESIYIFASDTRNEWRFVASRPQRPLSSIILDDGIKEKILDDANEFLNSRKWYAERGIPFRRGYLLVSLSRSHGNSTEYLTYVM